MKLKIIWMSFCLPIFLGSLLYSQSLIPIQDGGIYRVKENSNEIVLNSAVKLEWNISNSLGFVSVSKNGYSSNVINAVIITNNDENYNSKLITLPIKNEISMDLLKSGYNLERTLNGDILLVGTNVSPVMHFNDIEIMDPPSVVVTPYSKGKYICALHRARSSQSSNIGGYCSIIDKNTGIIEKDFALPEFCVSQLVKNIQWIDNRFIVCEAILHSGIQFSIIDTQKKTAFNGNYINNSYVNITSVSIINTKIVFSYYRGSYNNSTKEKWKTITIDQLMADKR